MENSTDSIYRKIVNWCKNRYSLEKDLDVWLVFILFGITGSSSMKVARPLLEVLGVTDSTEWYLYYPVRILAVFVAYQLLFVFYGFVIGFLRRPVWKFAWMFEKKMLSRLGIKLNF